MWLLLSGCDGDQDDARVLAEVAANMQKDKLVAEARLTSDYLARTMALLSDGESLQVTYHFSLRLEKKMLPDPLVAENIVRRRLRRNLILERYEMNDLVSKTTSFTADESEAARFLGNPRFVTVAKRDQLQPEWPYTITVTFRLDEEGVSRMLRVLREWIFFWEVNSHTIQSGYHLP